MSYFRFILLPFIAYIYVKADQLRDYQIAATLIALSGITDFLDGFIARKFHMITDLGKALDPIADKLTQVVITICLVTRFPYILIVVIILVLKEGMMGVLGVIFLKRNQMLNGAKLYGKISTAFLYVSMFVLILFPGVKIQIANTLILVSAFLLLLSFVMYIPVYRKMWMESE